MVSNRATLLAKLVTATRFSHLPITSLRVCSRSLSEPATPSTKTLVESQTMACTPSSPTRLRASLSDGAPTTGPGSNFQSPVCRTVPKGVRMAMALGSGIEWVRVISSRSKGPTEKRLPRSTMVISASSLKSVSANLRLRIEAVNGVA